MKKELNESWAGKIYSEKELEQLAKAMEQHKQKYTKEEIAAFQALWAELFAEVEAHLDKDPAGQVGKKLGMRYAVLNKQLEEAYKDYPGLWEAMSKAAEQGKIPDAVMPKKQRDWLEMAAKALKKLK